MSLMGGSPRLLAVLLILVALLAWSPLGIVQAASISGSVGWDIGGTVPVTLYLRFEKQVEPGIVSAWDEEGDLGKAQQKRPTKLPDRNPPSDTKVLVWTKHQAQLTRSIPPIYAPRFGINKIAELPIQAPMKRAKEMLEASPQSSNTHMALRFMLGGRLRKETTWLPLAVRRSIQKNPSLISFLLPEQIENLESEGEIAVRYLSHIDFFFGFQLGAINRITSFRVEYTYSESVPDVLELQYHWNEHQAYNTHRALTLCSVVVLLIAIIMANSMLSRQGRLPKLFRRKVVVVRAHED
ncbi:unnamed protein product [Phytomonas sp. EM1]|nr:unnamed protein product [Phytomonas sp. EM1]|eukprot:CCW63805.1 unnamed protein product [Phytomonas sp. isolate EM1]